MKRKALSLMLALIMVFGLIVPGTAFAECDELKWAASFGDDWTKAPSAPALVGDKIAVMSGDEIVLLSKADGSVAASGKMSGTPGYGAAPVAFDGASLYAPLGKGTVEAFDAKTLESKWVYNDSLGGQALSPILCANDKLYTGFWNGEAENASFVCLDAATGAKCWNYEVKGGFYWAGAVAVGDFIAVATDDGAKGSEGDSKLLVFKSNYAEGEAVAPVAELTLTGCGDVRCSLTYDGGKLYFTTKGGYLGSADVDEKTGALANLKTVSFGLQSVSSPVICGDYLYFGAGAGFNDPGKFMIADKASLEVKSSAELKGYAQCTMLLKSDTPDAEGYLNFYSTYNAMPGGVTLVRVNAADVSDIKVTELYDAAGYENYCVGSVITDGESLYYKNDSGSIFCLGEKVVTADVLVSIADKGSAELVRAEVSAADRNSDGKVDIDEVLAATHEKYCPGGYAMADGDYGAYITKLWNDESGNFGYFVDDQMAMSLGDAVSDGQHVYAYVNANFYPNNDAYAYFEASDGKTVKLVAQSGYDENWNPVFTGFEKASLKAYTADLKAEAEGFGYAELGGGEYSLSFANAGDYIVIATAENNAIIPAAVEVSVKAKVEFKDIDKDAYYYDAVLWGSDNDIINGVGGALFAPDGECTRAQIVTMLYRLAGSPAVSGESSFADVAEAWYADAVIWATERGITKGTGADTFSPDAVCTRGEAVTMLWRYYDSAAAVTGTSFADVTDKDAYYYDAVMWAAAEKISTGYPGGVFCPQNECTRAEIATLIYRAAA